MRPPLQKRPRIAAALLAVPVLLAPLYYILFCDWCGGVLFIYYWGLAVLGAASGAVYRKNRLLGLLCGLLALAILLASFRYHTFTWIWAAGVLAFVIAGWRKFVREGNRASRAAVLIFLAVGIIGSIAGLVRMNQMLSFRRLEAGSVTAVTLQRDGRMIRIDEPEEIAELLDALQQSFSYLPNHEGIQQAWELRIRLRDGGEITGRVGDGTRAYADAAYIELCGNEYQSRRVYRILRGRLWGTDRP